jgi:1-phosphofructokinase family hexose kinase
MILCVTLNPCLDKTLTVPPWQPGDSIRGVAVREVAGGKGNNVARALRRLGRISRPVTFLGGAVGNRCRELLAGEGFDPMVIPSTVGTREILTVRTHDSPNQTAFFDPDPAIAPGEVQALCEQVGAALASGVVEALTLSGSSPSEASHEAYSELIALAQARGVATFLDTYGPSLASIWGFWPNVMQLNRREAATHVGVGTATDADIWRLLDRWSRRGVPLALVTDGPNPVLVQSQGKRFRAIPPPMSVVNPVGSGDSLLAGVVDAWLAGNEPEQIIRHGVACACANVATWDAGAIDIHEVSELERRVSIAPG